jgi:hypothetical protein
MEHRSGLTTRHPGYAISQTIRKRIEEHFGWGKTVGRIRQTVYRGLRRVDQHFKLTMTGFIASKFNSLLSGNSAPARVQISAWPTPQLRACWRL